MKKTNLKLIASTFAAGLTALAALLAAPLAARADTITLTFGYADNNGTVSGDATLTASYLESTNDTDVYLASAGSLVISAPVADGIAGTYGLISNPGGNPSYSPNGGFIYDDLVYLGSNPPDTWDIVTNPGVLAFALPNTNLEVNFFSNGPQIYDLYTGYGAGNYPYSYQFTTATAPGSFPYVNATVSQSVNSISVPDGGMTVALLGLSLAALTGAEALRRKLAAG